MSDKLLTPEDVEGRLRMIWCGEALSHEVGHLMGDATVLTSFAGVPLNALLLMVKGALGTTRDLKATDDEVSGAAIVLKMTAHEGLVSQAFKGRPARQMMEMCRWLLSKQGTRDEYGVRFDKAKALGDWAMRNEEREARKRLLEQTAV